MNLSLNLQRILGVSALLLVASGMASAGTNRLAALPPGQLVEIRAFLISANRAELTLLNGPVRTGRIESVTDRQIVLRTKVAKSKTLWELQTVAAPELRHLRLWHTRQSAWRARLGRALGFWIGIVAAAPVISAAAQSGSGIGAWTALVGFPAAGLILGERFARGTQETLVPVLQTPPVSDSVTRP